MGGLSYAEDVEKFKKKVHIVVGSPGRLLHLIKQKHIDVSSVRLIVLDEADKLVDKSFLPDINYIFSRLPAQKQIIMSSATYPEEIKTVMKNYVQNAHHICPDSSSVLLGIKQNVTVVPNHVNIVKQTKYRYEEVIRILSKNKFKQCLVFCNYQVRVGEVQRMLTRDKWPADKLYGQQDQTDRLGALKILQEYQCRILVTTDLAARGIDASNVDLVINFEIPYDWQTYLHRIGRAGRYGSYGNAITILCGGDEEKKFKSLLGSINIPFELKNFWTNEPFLLDSIKTGEETCPKREIESQPEIKEPERKLGIKETYEELWKVLSVDSTEPKKEMHDIPTFESLRHSFEETNREANIDKTESNSDSLSSFQNHEIKSKENSNYNPVVVNQLLIPCNIFNHNIILQNLQKQNSDLSHAENYNTDDLNKSVSENSNLDPNGIDSNNYTMNTCFSPISKPRLVLYENVDSQSEYSEDANTSENEEPNDHIYKSKQNGNKQQNSENNDVYFPAAGSSEYNSKSQTNITNESSYNQSKSVPVSSKTNFNDDQNYLDESKLQKSYEYNHLPTAFGKVRQTNIIKSEQQSEVGRKKHFSGKNTNKRNSKYQVKQPPTSAKQRVAYVHESTDDEESDSFSLRSLGGKSSKGNSHHAESRKPISNYGTNKWLLLWSNGLKMSNSVIEERQQQFDLWYNQLKTQMLLIERSVYIAEISSPY